MTKVLEVLCCLAVVLANVCDGADFQIDTVSKQGSRSEIRFSAEAGFYYILWRGNTPREIRLATDTALSGGTQTLLADTNATNSAQFYRVEKVPLTSLRDTDGDGISDAWELLHRHPGAALNGNDADEDQDGNGVPDRIDALRESLRVGVRGRGVLAAGNNHTLALQTNGTLWTWGDNYFGQCGLGVITETNLPTKVGTANNWITIAAGANWTIGVRSDGTLWTWGDTHKTPFGSGPTTNDVPVRIGTETNWLSAAADQAYLTALKTDGSLWNVTDLDAMRVGTDNDWASLAGAQAGFLLIKNDGGLWYTETPTNVPSRLGVASNCVAAVRGTDYASRTIKSYFINSDGRLAWLGDGFGAPVPVEVESNWVAIAAGAYHFVGLKTDGTLWLWGDNSYSQCGSLTPSSIAVPTRLGGESNWIAVAAGPLHTLALKADGTVWTWGDNSLGQLGNGAVGIVMKPMQIGTEMNWASAYTGHSFSFGIRTDGTLWSWGENRSGQLGLGHSNNLCTPTQVGLDANWLTVDGGGKHVIALKTDGTLWSWGDNTYGQLGNGTTGGTSLPGQAGTNNDWTAISAGIQHNLAIGTNRTLWVWGRNDDGSLGLGFGSGDAAQPTIVPGISNVRFVAADYYSSAAIRGTSILTWGRDAFSSDAFFGGPVQQQPTPAPMGTGWVAIATSVAHSSARHILALKSDGTLWGAGSALYGQNGLESLSTNVLTQVGSEMNWSAVAIGDLQSFALKTDGTLWSWGYGAAGGRESRQAARRPTQVGSDTNWQSISAGFLHTLAVRNDGTLWGWGKNTSGQLAQSATWTPQPVAGISWGRTQ